MPKTILADVSGFTPVIDRMAMDHGLVYAAVFGRMWRFCQMEDGVCKASLDKIASGLHIDKATVMRYAERLVEDGYLKDLTPDRRNAPHIYADTGKAAIRVGIGATVAGCNAEVDDSETVAQCNAGVAGHNATVAHDQLKIVSKKHSKDTKEGIPNPDFDAACAILQELYPADYSQAAPVLLEADERPYRLHVRLSVIPPDFIGHLADALREVNPRRNYRLTYQTIGTGRPAEQGEREQPDAAPDPYAPDDTITGVLPGHSMMTPEQAWTAALGELQLEMTRATFDTWIKPTVLISVNGSWKIGVPDKYAQEFFVNRLRSTIQRILTGIIDNPVVIECVVMEPRR